MNAQLYHTMKVRHERDQFASPEDKYSWSRIDAMESRSGSIWMPFTAQTGNQLEDRNTYQIRLNWCKVLKSVITEQGDINSIAYNVVSDMIGGHYGHTRSRIIRGSPPLIIDTAISGQAAAEISDALDSIGVSNYKIILAVDSNGSRLKQEYKEIFLAKKHDKFKLVYFDDLFTEDQGPALSNVFGVIYPNLTQALRGRFSDPSIAVGSLHMVNGRDILCKKDQLKLRDYARQLSANASPIDRIHFQCAECKAMGGALNTIYSILRSLFIRFAEEELRALSITNEIQNELTDWLLNKQIADLSAAMSSFGFRHTSTSLELFRRLPPLGFETDDSISSSHVLRCNIDTSDVERILQQVSRCQPEFRDHYIDL
jgi:hypothetical protein